MRPFTHKEKRNLYQIGLDGICLEVWYNTFIRTQGNLTLSRMFTFNLNKSNKNIYETIRDFGVVTKLFLKVI